MKKKKNNPELSHDVLIEILARLPVQTLRTFKTVCSSWRSTIQSPHFSRLQASYCSNHDSKQKLLLMETSGDFHIADVNTLSVRKIVPGFQLTSPLRLQRLQVYSSNGVLLLLLVDEEDHERLVLWNPATGKYKDISYLPRSASGFFGFSYDTLSGKFRILSVTNQQQVFVFDSSNNSWTKTIHTHPPNFDIVFNQRRSTKTFIHGGFHVAAHDSHTCQLQILSFSQDGELIRVLPPPPKRRNSTSLGPFVSLVVCEGRLCLQINVGWDIEFWCMEEYGKAESWNKILSLKNTYYSLGYSVHSVLQNGRRLLVTKMEGNKPCLCVKDCDSDEMDFILPTHACTCIQMVGIYSYTPSLLNP